MFCIHDRVKVYFLKKLVYLSVLLTEQECDFPGLIFFTDVLCLLKISTI